MVASGSEKMLGGLPGSLAPRLGVVGSRRLKAVGPLSGPQRSLASVDTDDSVCPKCMDRLPFASEVVLSEVADMYPAC